MFIISFLPVNFPHSLLVCKFFAQLRSHYLYCTRRVINQSPSINQRILLPLLTKGVRLQPITHSGTVLFLLFIGASITCYRFLRSSCRHTILFLFQIIQSTQGNRLQTKPDRYIMPAIRTVQQEAQGVVQLTQRRAAATASFPPRATEPLGYPNPVGAIPHLARYDNRTEI
jgi:hypothetical protein